MVQGLIMYFRFIIIRFFVGLHEVEIAMFFDKLKLILDCVEWE